MYKYQISNGIENKSYCYSTSIATGGLDVKITNLDIINVIIKAQGALNNIAKAL